MLIRSKWGWAFVASSLLLGSLSACAQKPVEWGYRVVATYPHDESAFTQGLFYLDGKLYEGTGGNPSTLRRVQLATGEIEHQVTLAPQYFGEGITLFDGKILQLTWRSRLGFIYELGSFKPIGSFEYAGEGWGLATDGKELIMSDGTPILRFLDPKTFQLKRKVSVHWGKQKVSALNELEYVEGEIWANIWYEDRIARISPRDGQVLGWINLSGLIPRVPENRERVLNGIAYDPEGKRVWVTGKNWPSMFEIEVVPINKR